MNIFYTIFLLSFILLMIGIFVKRKEIKIYFWKKSFFDSKEKYIIETIFMKNFIFYKHLDNKFKEKLLLDTYIMSKLKIIEGINIDINDEIKYTIFGLSGLLILGDENPDYFPNLTSVVVYPRMYISDQKHQEKTVNLGESWNFGVVVLSWMDVLKGALDFTDGHNVVLHEFAHQLDQQNGTADGIPVHLNVDYDTWKNTFDIEYKKLIKEMQNAETDSIDFYGTTNKAEFFAVATETFFEEPKKMKSEHPNFYNLLVKYYRIDPIQIFKIY